MTDATSVLRIWKEYYKGVMHEENEREGERERRENDGEIVNLEVERISKREVRENMSKRMKNGKVVGPDDPPVEVWKCIGEIALEFLMEIYNITMESVRMPEEWRDDVMESGRIPEEWRDNLMECGRIPEEWRDNVMESGRMPEEWRDNVM